MEIKPLDKSKLPHAIGYLELDFNCPLSVGFGMIMFFFCVGYFSIIIAYFMLSTLH